MAAAGQEVAVDTKLTGGGGLSMRLVRPLCLPSAPRPSAFRAGQPQAFAFSPLL